MTNTILRGKDVCRCYFFDKTIIWEAGEHIGEGS